MVAAPPRTAAAFAEQQKYLKLALSSDEKAELSLMAAEMESAAIATYAQAQHEEAHASAARRQAMAPLLRALAVQMELAGEISKLVSFMDDHQLRGQIRFLKHALGDDDDDDEGGGGGGDGRN